LPPTVLLSCTFPDTEESSGVQSTSRLSDAPELQQLRAMLSSTKDPSTSSHRANLTKSTTNKTTPAANITEDDDEIMVLSEVASASSRAAEKPTAVVSAVRHPPGVTATVERSSIDRAFPTISAALRGPSMPIRAPTTIPRAGFTTINHPPMPVPPPMRYIRHPTNGLVVGPVTVTPQIAPSHLAVNNMQSVSNAVQSRWEHFFNSPK
jgi:hypothetical protein